MGWFSRIIHRTPLRIAIVVLCVVILIPAVWVMSLVFPNVSRETIAVIFAFMLAGYLAFHVIGR